MIKAIALDFDGVILESVEVKTRAFGTLFQGYPEHLEEIICLHRQNGGISRHKKFEIIYRDFLKKPLSVFENDRLSREFSKLVFDEMLDCPLVPGVLEFLRERSSQMPVFIVSGTPEAELKEIVMRRNLDCYVRGSFGSPRTKDVLLREVLGVEGLGASELMFVGDSMTDYTACMSIGANFVGRVPSGLANPFPHSIRWVVSDLGELANRWPAILTQL